ncbi:MAG: preprotein translocase subunit SecG, partial [Shimia sp.]
LLALALIGVVLLQRSEGGGLGLGGGGGGAAPGMGTRGQGNALTKATWALGWAFMAAALAMSIIAARNAQGVSVVDQLGLPERSAPAPVVPSGEDLLPPSGDDGPLLPTAD